MRAPDCSPSVALLLASLLLAAPAAGCGGALGGLPEREEPELAEDAPPVPERFPGPAWASHRQTGFLVYGIAVERREEDRATRVVYADGSDEWVARGYVHEDEVGAGAEVSVRDARGQPYYPAELSRRLGDAAFVRFRGGEERWTTFAHIRFDEGGQLGQRADPSSGSSAEPEGGFPVGARVLAEYRAEGFLFPATVTARREDGRLFVVYADGASEWIPPAHVRADDLAEGSAVQFAPVGPAGRPMRWEIAEIRARHAHALRLSRQDGGISWTSLARVRLPLAAAGSVEGNIEQSAGPGAAEP